jgi:hypothetical protein
MGSGEWVKSVLDVPRLVGRQPGWGGEIYEMLTTLARRIVLIYVCALLVVQGLFHVIFGWLAFLGRGPDTRWVAFFLLALIATALGAVEVSAAVFLTRGRRWAAIVAIVLEVLWTAIAVVSAASDSGGPPVGQYYVGAALFLAAIIGLLLKPVRSYCGLARRWRLSRSRVSGKGLAHPNLPTSSSRSQLASCRACVVGRLARGSVSGVVRRCPPWPMVIVTQLVTRR